jgi:hypothetical protein
VRAIVPGPIFMAFWQIERHPDRVKSGEVVLGLPPPNIVSRLFFYSALLLSALLTFVLLSAAANFGFGQVIAAGPVALLIVVVMLLNPVIFGFLGFVKGTPRWHIVAAGAMLTLLSLYTLAAYGVFGSLPDGRF